MTECEKETNQNLRDPALFLGNSYDNEKLVTIDNITKRPCKIKGHRRICNYFNKHRRHSCRGLCSTEGRVLISCTSGSNYR